MPTPQAFDQLPNGPQLIWVQADRRLIQNDQFRLVHQRVRETHALFVSFRKLSDDPFLHVL